MKITKHQLRRIIKEEKVKVLKEQWGSQESFSPLVAFAQAWSGLGGAIQDQMITVVNGYIENNPEDVYEINPNALTVAMERLRGPLRDLGGAGGCDADASDLQEAFEWAQDIFAQGELDQVDAEG